MQKYRCGLALLAILSTAGLGQARAGEPIPSPSMQAYQDVSVAREKYGDVISGGKPATPEQLRQIDKDLHASLVMMDEPRIHDLAEGNLYLRYRRYNILTDLIKLHARMGEKDAALREWRDLVAMDWDGRAQTLLLKDPNVAQLKGEPGFAPIAATYRAASWWSTGDALKTPYRPTLPVAERIAGLSKVWTIAREGFVWFDHVPELDWDKAYLETLPKVMVAERTDDYYRVLTGFVVQLHDGHSNVYPPGALEDHVYARPGLRTRLVGDRVIVLRVEDVALVQAGVVVGDELVRVDGEPVREYADRHVLPYQSSSTPQDRDVREFTYALLSGDAKTPVALSFRGAGGKAIEVSAARSGYAKAKPEPKPPLFHLRDDGIAVLTANEFEDDASPKALERNLDALMTSRGLVLDLRGNGGGSTEYGIGILAHLSRKPVPAMASSYRDDPSLSLARDDHSGVHWRISEQSGPAEVPARVFEGPVVMLIDAQTFSAGEDTAATFKWMKRGRLVGMPSGGSTGQPYLFGLPGGGTARICVKRDTYPDGTDFVGVGVLPDMRVDATVDDIRGGRDPVLEAAIAALKQDGK